MADKKISQLNAVITLGNNDLFPVVQGAETKKAKISDIKSYLPTASSLNTGLLSNTDWTTFNNKQNALTLGNLTESTSSVLTITGGTGSIIGSGTTIQVKQASGSQSGFLSSTDWTTFNNKMTGLTLTTTGTSGAATYNSGTATLNIPQYLGAAVTSINGSTTAAQTIQTGSTGTDFTIGTVAGVTTVAIPTASASARGLLSTTDWSTFNGKQNALTIGNLTESTSSVLTITGGIGSVIGSGTTIEIKKASGSQDGYLASSDFTTFAGKQNAITLTTTGSSGAATFIGNVLNIPQYSGGGGGITTLNTLTATTQTFATGTSGTDFGISSSGTTHTFNIPTASASNRGALSSSDWSTFNGKQNAITLTTTGTSGAATLVGSTLNIPQYSGGGGTSTALNQQAGFAALGGSMVGMNIANIQLAYTTTLGLTSGLLYLTAIYIPTTTTINGAKWFVAVNGSITANNYNGIGLYSYSGGTLTLVASSTNDSNIWSQGTGWKSKAFSSSYSASAGVYFIGVCSSWSASATAPNLGSYTTAPSVAYYSMDFTNSARLVCSRTSITALPSSIAMSSVNNTSSAPTIILY